VHPIRRSFWTPTCLFPRGSSSTRPQRRSPGRLRPPGSEPITSSCMPSTGWDLTSWTSRSQSPAHSGGYHPHTGPTPPTVVVPQPSIPHGGDRSHSSSRSLSAGPAAGGRSGDTGHSPRGRKARSDQVSGILLPGSPPTTLGHVMSFTTAREQSRMNGAIRGVVGAETVARGVRCRPIAMGFSFWGCP
jgi:hypothetical protein